VPGDFPLAGRDMPADPTRTYVPGESGQAIAQASGVLQSGVLEEAEEEDVDEAEDLGPPDDPFLESDRRLRDPARTFGEQEPIEEFTDVTESSFERGQDIGEGIAGQGGAVEPARGQTVAENWQQYLAEQEAQQRIEEAQRREVLAEDELVAEEEDLRLEAESRLGEEGAQAEATIGEGMGRVGPDELFGVFEGEDVRGRGRTDEAADQRGRIDQPPIFDGLLRGVTPATTDAAQVGERLGQEQVTVPEQATAQEVGNPLENLLTPDYGTPTETVTEPGYGTPPAFGFGTPAVATTKLPRLEFPGADDDDFDDEFGEARAEVLAQFRDPFTGELIEDAPQP
jgi:hypothetical protein